MEYLNAYTWGHGSPRGFTKKSDAWKHSMDEMILSSGCDTLLLPVAARQDHAYSTQVDFETDIYSLGIVMYEMLTGKVPFTGDNPVSVALKHMQDKPQSLIQQRSDIPIELERIIFKALEKKPSYRFKSMQEMADALIDLQLYLEEKGYFKNGSSLSAAEKYTVEPLDLETGMMTRKESYKRNTINDNTRVMDYDIPYDAGVGRQLKFELEEETLQARTELLKGLSIVISGVFTHHSRDEYKEMIENNGGKNVGSVSKSTSFILAGENMGPAKLEKANKLGVRFVSEEEFLAMLV